MEIDCYSQSPALFEENNQQTRHIETNIFSMCRVCWDIQTEVTTCCALTYGMCSHPEKIGHDQIIVLTIHCDVPHMDKNRLLNRMVI